MKVLTQQGADMRLIILLSTVFFSYANAQYYVPPFEKEQRFYGVGEDRVHVEFNFSGKDQTSPELFEADLLSEKPLFFPEAIRRSSWIELSKEYNKKVALEIASPKTTGHTYIPTQPAMTEAILFGSHEYRVGNLTNRKADLEVSFLKDDFTWESKTYQLEAKGKLKLPLAKSASIFKVKSTQRIAVSTDNTEAMIEPQTEKLNVDKKASYYLMTNEPSDNLDSFIIKVDNEALIEKLDQALKDGSYQYKVMSGAIKEGHGNFNRDLYAQHKPTWSFHVDEVYGFYDFASQACDGTPLAVEYNLDHWIENLGRICFWSYHLKRKLTPDEVAGN
jgi:hypothetical protein